MAGARVIPGPSTADKREYAEKHGAHLSIDYTKEDWRKELKSLTEGHGIDVIFDPVAGSLLEPAFKSLAWRGRHLVVGFVGGEIPTLPVNLALLKGSALIGVDYRQFGSVFEPQVAKDVQQKLFGAVERGDLTPPLGATFDFQNIRDAMSFAAQRDGQGKTVVLIGSDA